MELEDEPQGAVAERAQCRFVVCEHVLAADLDPAGLGPVERAQHVEERRLPHTRGPDDRQHLARGDVEVEVLEDGR